MWSSRCLMIFALAMTSGAAIPLGTSEDPEDPGAATLSPNDVDVGLEGLRKFARTQFTEGRSGGDSVAEAEREKSGESGDDEEAPQQLAGAKDESQPRSAKRGRKHKAFFLNYPFAPQVRRYQSASSRDGVAKSHNDLSQGSQKPGHRKRFQQESQIYYIKLPPTPYMFVPGLGYISQPPTFSTSSLQRPNNNNNNNNVQRPARPQHVHHKPTAKPFINVPIDFVSNGKPTGVYQWTGSKRPETSLNSLNEGPYVFNGRPTSLYLLTPDGQQTGHQPIRLADYSGKGYY